MAEASAAAGAGADAAAADPMEPFNAATLANKFRSCRDHIHDIPIDEFVSGCEEVKKIIATLGSAFGIASHDITEKCGILMKRCVPGLYGASRRLWSGYNVASCNECRRAELEETARAEGLGLATPLASGEPPATDGTTGPVRLTLQYMISREIAKNIANSNNSHYVSGARSLLRLMWFLDYVGTLLGNLLAHPEVTSLQHSASTAYEEALAPHHPWLLRKTIGAAMYFLPTREAFLNNLSPGLPAAELTKKLQEFCDLMNPVRLHLWDFYRKRNIQDLP